MNDARSIEQLAQDNARGEDNNESASGEDEEGEQHSSDAESICVSRDAFPSLVLPLVSLSLPLVSLSFQPRTYNLSTLHFPDSVQIWKILENNLDVLTFLENNLDVLKFPENNLEVLKIQKKNLYGA
ncbi:hypothetical protein Tco_0597922 [Tanacetum coccineum]